MSSSAPIRLMIVEDHFLVRMGLSTATEGEADIQIVAEAENGPRAIELYRVHQPSVVIMDLRLPGLDGIATCAAIREEFPDARILILSSFHREADVHRAFEAGARGYVLKGMPHVRLLEAIRAVSAGESFVPSEIAQSLAEHVQHVSITSRELEVLRLAAQGKSNKEIGTLLNITEGTVKTHVANVLEKLDAMDRTQAVTTALRRGLIHLE